LHTSARTSHRGTVYGQLIQTSGNYLAGFGIGFLLVFRNGDPLQNDNCENEYDEYVERLCALASLVVLHTQSLKMFGCTPGHLNRLRKPPEVILRHIADDITTSASR